LLGQTVHFLVLAVFLRTDISRPDLSLLGDLLELKLGLNITLYALKSSPKFYPVWRSFGLSSSNLFLWLISCVLSSLLK